MHQIPQVKSSVLLYSSPLQTPKGSPEGKPCASNWWAKTGGNYDPLQLSMPIPNADYYMYLWLTCYKSRGSHHFSGLNTLLEWLRELRKTCWLTRLPIFYKKDTKIQESVARWRDPRRKHRKKAEPPSPPQTHHFPHSPRLATQKLSKPWKLHYMGMVDHWPLVIDLASRPFPHTPTGGASKTESSSLITWFSWQLAPTFERDQKVTFPEVFWGTKYKRLNIISLLLLLRKSQGFWKL